MLAPYSAELDVEIAAAAHTTTLSTSTASGERSQRMLAWAGEMDSLPQLESTILHLAPVARETGAHWRGRARFVGLTPQGLVRSWSRIGAPIRAHSLDRTRLPQTWLDSAVLRIRDAGRANNGEGAALLKIASETLPEFMISDGQQDPAASPRDAES